MIVPDVDFTTDPSMDYQTKACIKLWASVFRVGLTDSARDFFNGRTNWWFDEANHSNYPGSFLWLCDLFGYDPDIARAKARMKFRELARRNDVPKDEDEVRTAVADEVPADQLVASCVDTVVPSDVCSSKPRRPSRRKGKADGGRDTVCTDSP